LIFSILLQHQISEHSKYFWSNFRSIHFHHLTKPCTKCSNSLDSSLNLSTVWCRKEFFCWCWMLLLSWQSWI
jgi:hypothetical protein